MEASSFSTLQLKPPNFFSNVTDVAMLDHIHMRPHKRGDLVCRNIRVGDNSLPVSQGRNSRQSSRSRSFKSCQVTRDESGEPLSGENIALNEQTLERELQIAIEEENYAQAAKIRDDLRLLQEDSKASVMAANAKFYDSFRNGDLAAMQSLWSKDDHVCVVHPGVSGISGYDLVMGSWEFVWADCEFPLQFEIKDVQIHVRGDIGYVTCIEMVRTKGTSWRRHFATNVFERIDGRWFICIHHASYIDL